MENKNALLDLVDIKDVKVDTTLSREQRIKEYVKQIKNPYNFKCGNIEIVATFWGNGLSLEECIKGLMK